MREDIGDGYGYDSSDSSSSSSSDHIAPAANTDFFRGVAGDDDFTHGTRGNGAEREQEDIDASSDDSVPPMLEEIDEEEADEEVGDDDSVPRMLEEIEEEEADEEELKSKFVFEEEDEQEDKAVEVPWETDIRSLWSRAKVPLADDADDICFKRMKELAEHMEEHGYSGHLKVMSTGNNDELRALAKTRHPSFDSALDNLGDPLDVIHLVAVVPARVGIDLANVIECRWLSWNWQAYIASTHKLRKVFMTRDAIFFQAKVNGRDITWSIQRLVPQKLPNDVGREVWFGFIRFFMCIMNFANFKLYTAIGLKYPGLPTEGLHPLLEHVRRELIKQGNKDEDEETKVCKGLFQDKKFFLGREVTRDPFLFVITSFGGVVSYEGEATPFREDDKEITHQIVCLATKGHRYPGRAYVQPQWILDCINQRLILPTDSYLVERDCPPHLSPFAE